MKSTNFIMGANIKSTNLPKPRKLMPTKKSTFRVSKYNYR